MAAETRNCGAARRGAMPPPKDVVKIAIQMVGAIPQLIELQQVPPGSPRSPPPRCRPPLTALPFPRPQSKPLAAVLKDVCDA